MEHELANPYPALASAFSDMPERFPVETARRHGRLLGTLDRVWGTAEALDHLSGLLFSDRPDRQGFVPGVMVELMALWKLHDSHYPEFKNGAQDAFAATEFSFAREERKRRAQKARRSRADRCDPPQAPAEPAAATPSPWPTLRDIDDLQAVVHRRSQGHGAPARDTRKLLDILRAHCTVDQRACAEVLAAHLNSDTRPPLGKMLTAAGAAADEDVTRALCLQNGILQVDLARFDIAADAAKRVPVDVARGKRVVPLALIGNVLFLAMENPLIFAEREYFAFLTDFGVEGVMAARADIDARLADYGQARSALEADQEFRDLAQRSCAPPLAGALAEYDADEAPAVSQDDATVVGLVNRMIMDAADNGASDVHIERFPGNDAVQIRVRRDGRLESYSEYPASYHDAVVSRIKIIAGLDITERRRPQDGKISFPRAGQDRLDLRVATIPTLRAIENAVIRLLHPGDPIPLPDIGMARRELDIFQRLIRRPYGLFLVCGPTGSGKTTTLHSALRELNCAPTPT